MLKILQINKFFYQKGGAETYFFELAKMLKKHGHKIINFSQTDTKNAYSPQRKYFLSKIDLVRWNWPGAFKVGRIFWSPEARKKISQLIADKKPEIAHIHNIYHQISPSILPALKKNNIKIVMTVHDFKLISPRYTLRADGKKTIHKNSLLAEILINLEFLFHRLTKVYQKNIDLFIAPSQFVKDELIQAGFKPEKIEVVPHFVNQDIKSKNPKNKNYLLSFGRLDESKGVDWLIKSFAKTKSKNIKLKIAGDGPQANELKMLVKGLDLQNRVEFCGQKNREELRELIGGAIATIFPSRVHETFGLGIIESFINGKPVIASKTGAFTELIKNKTGKLVKINNQKELTAAINFMVNNPRKRKEMGQMAQKTAEKDFSPAKHYAKISKIYNKILK